ncbi:MAG: YHS domain-containing (seleno)protein [Pseudomonadota bacterium]
MAQTRRNIIIGAASLSAVGLVLASRHATASVGRVYSEDGVAVDGSDVVAYFERGGPVAGRADTTHDWKGVTWRFSSDANRAAFVANPDAYAPQYGGFCAYAVSRGYTASTVPEAWRIVDGKLYLNYSRRIQRKWERDIPGNIKAGNANWPVLLG